MNYPCQIECVANRSSKYRVSFDSAGSVCRVESVYRRDGDTGRVYRTLWRDSGMKMTTTVACAIRAAIAKIRTEA
jgi:hypothetical protein